MSNDKVSSGQKLLQWIAGVGPAAAGGAISASVGGADFGLAAVGGAEIGLKSKEFVSEFFTKRTEEKCINVIEGALAEADQLAKEGAVIRADWADNADDLNGLLEHTLMIARDTYETKKLKYISLFLARTLFDINISADDAHRYYNQFKQLTWREIKVLGAFYNVKAQSDIHKDNKHPALHMGMSHEEMYAHSGCVLLLDQKKVDALPPGLGGATRTLMVQGMVQSKVYRSLNRTYYDIASYGMNISELFGLDRLELDDWVEYASELTKNVADHKVSRDFIEHRHFNHR